MLKGGMPIRKYITNASPRVRVLVGISAAILLGHVLFTIDNQFLYPHLSGVEWYLRLLVELIVLTFIVWALGVVVTNAKKVLMLK